MTYSSAVLALSPSVCLKLDETTGTTAADSSGNGFAAQHLGTPVPVVGQVSLLADGSGRSVLYNSGGYTSITPVASANTATPSLNLRYRPNSASLSGVQVIAARWSGPRGFLWLFTLNGGKPEVTLKLGGVDRVVTAPTVLTAGQDYTLGFTYDGTTLRLYVDGSQVGSLAIAGSVASTTAEFEIARAAEAVFGTGQIDGFAYWTRALSAADMATLHTEATSTAIAGSLAATLPILSASLTGLGPPETGDLAVTLPVLQVAATGDVTAAVVDGTLAATLPTLSVALDGTSEVPPAAPVPPTGFGLVLGSSTASTVIAPTSTDSDRVPLHVITPTVPTPTLVDGRPA